MSSPLTRFAGPLLRRLGVWSFGHAGLDPPGAASLHALQKRIGAGRETVVFLPSVGWDITLRQRPHHLARELVRRGFTVVFDRSNERSAPEGLVEIEPSLFLFRGPLETLTTIPSPWLWALPYNAHLARRFERPFVIYDWIDDLSVFPWPQSILRRRHLRALRDASLVLTVARGLHEEALKSRGDALYVPNAADVGHFAPRSAPALEDEELRAILDEGKPIAGYYGAFASWVDYDLLDAVAQSRPGWNFVLIGQMLDGGEARHRLFGRENVRFLVPRPYEALPAILQHFTVAMIPFRSGAIARGTSPLKLYEYFAGERAVVSTPLPECEQFDVVEIARSPAEFAAAIDRARERAGDQPFRARVRAIAQESSWGSRVDVVVAAAQQRKLKMGR